MAIEKNPFEQKTETTNVVSIETPQADADVSFEVDTDGGVVVNFGEEEPQDPLHTSLQNRIQELSDEIGDEDKFAINFNIE